MQAEESKVTIESDRVDSDDEHEKQEEHKEHSVSTIKFSSAIPTSLKAIVIAEDSHSQALFKIIFDGKLI